MGHGYKNDKNDVYVYMYICIYIYIRRYGQAFAGGLRVYNGIFTMGFVTNTTLTL